MSKDARRALASTDIQSEEEGSVRVTPVENARFNALHVMRRPSNNLILSILDRRHSRLQMRMNWRNFER